MNVPSQQLQVTVVGDDVSPLDTADDRYISVSTTEAEALSPQDVDTDCLVVDGPQVGSWRDLVDRLTDYHPRLPVVVLVAEADAATVGDAIDAGATDYLPQSLWAERPSLVANRLVAVAETEPTPVDGTDSKPATAVDRSDASTGPVLDSTARGLFESVSDGLVIHEGDTGEILDCNGRFCELTGYSRDELVGQTVDCIATAGDEFPYERARALIRRAAEEGPQLFEWMGEREDGETYPVEVHLDRVAFGDGERVLASVRDITERHERQRRLEAARDRRSVLFENSPDPIVTVTREDGQPHITEVNTAFEETFGFDDEVAVDKSLSEVVVPDDRQERHHQLRDRALSGDQLEAEVRRQTTDGLKDFLLRVLPYETDDDSRAYVWYTDVTEQRDRERAIRTFQQATERMQRADSCEAIASIATEAAQDALGLPSTGCWLYDDERDRLDPVTVSWGAEADQPSLSPGCYGYEVFEAGTVTRYRPDDDPEERPTDWPSTRRFESGLVLPLGDHGLLAVGCEDAGDDTVNREIAATLAEQTETALSRVKRAREVRESQHRLQAIVDRIDEAIFLAPARALTDDDLAPDFVSSGYEAIWGQSLEAIHERHEEGFFSTLHPDDYDSYVAFIERIVDDIESESAADAYSREYRIERPDGELRWVHSDFYPIEWTTGPQRVVIASRDVTDRKKRDQRLESFHDATAELTTAETVVDAGQVAVEAAADVFDLPATAVYHYDAETARLNGRATGPEMPDPSNLPSLSADNSRVWATFIGDGMARLSVDDDPALAVGPSAELLVFPLGGNGVLAVWRVGETFDTDAASILAATLEAALNRLRGERQLESRREELAAQTERLERLDAVAELTQRVEAAITTHSSRQGIQDAVCTELVDLDPFCGAWIAAAEVGTDRLTPRAVAGIDRDHVEQVLGSEPTDPHPAVDAWQTSEARVVNDLVGGGRRSSWRQLLLTRGAGAICAVPLAYGGITYGVLTIAADEPGAFGDRERDVLAQLSQSIGYAITAIERRRALESDDTIELEFEGAEMQLPIARLARETDCELRHERTIRRQDGSVSVYYSLRGEIDDAVAAADRYLPGEVRMVAQDGDKTVIERQGSSWFGSLISEYGGVLRQGQASVSGVTLIVELPREADVRTIVERLQTAFPALELTAKRRHRETASTPSEVRTRLADRLTDRQYEALETAHAMGYFEWPRKNSGEEVADRLGITQPTVNKHIRLGERKLFDLFFGSN